MRRCYAALGVCALAMFALTGTASAADPPCVLEPKSRCFGIESVDVSLSSTIPTVEPTQAGGHPDLTITFDISKDPTSPANVFGLQDSYAETRNVRIELPPGVIGDPNVLGGTQLCAVQELITYDQPGGGCPNGSQIGRSKVYAYGLDDILTEPIYMMQPPGGDAVARVGFIAGLFATFIDFRLRSEDQRDYGLTAEITDASAEARLIRAETTTWGIPAHPSHDNERCTPGEVIFKECVVSPSRPPGSSPSAFLTNPTRCGVQLEMRVAAASWAEPQRFDTKSTPFPQITGCNKLPFGPSLVIEPTNRRAAAPVGLDITARSPGATGVEVLEPSQTRDLKVTLPQGLAINPSSGDGLEVCTAQQAKFGQRIAAECPDAAKMAEFEADIAALPRRLKGAVYLRDPEPGNPFRVWAIADDLGAHVKLPGQLNVDKQTGQIESILLDLPQAPLREVKVVFKSGFRAPLMNPSRCGNYASSYEFTPWSGGPRVKALSPIAIDQGCEGTGGFDPQLKAGTTDPTAGEHSPFVFTLTREDGEQNPQELDITLPTGLSASFSGIQRCVGVDAATGACPATSRIGRVVAATGAGPTPLWVPQPGKRPTGVYLAGPYKGAPLSVVAVVPAQAGPFDFGDIVVRSALYVNPVTAQGTVKADPIPQIIEGIPIATRTISVILDRSGFTLNPTSCAQKKTVAMVRSSEGAVAHPESQFAAANCAKLPFEPQFFFKLRGGTRRGAHPSLRAVVKPRAGDANFAKASVALPHSEFLDQGHIGTVCTRVQFADDACPPASIYGHAVAKTPLLDEPLSGPLYLRSSSNPLPDAVAALKGPDGIPIEVELAGRVDSINGGIRNTFDVVPDAPVSSFVLTLKGGDKGLLVNSTNLCRGVHRTTVKLVAQNGRRLTINPELKTSCGKGKKSAGGGKSKTRTPR